MLVLARVALADFEPIQLTAVTIYPQNNIGQNCSMLSAGGGTAPGYSTAAVEGNAFAFQDPLPAGAILHSMFVTISMLAPCASGNQQEVKINPHIANVHTYYSFVGNFQPTASADFQACTSGQFQEVAMASQSMIGPDTPLYQVGGTNVISVNELAGTCSDVRIEYVRVTFRYYLNVSEVQFDLATAAADDRNILMHRWRTDYGYLSQYQTLVPGVDRDHRVMITGTVVDSSGAPVPNRTIYLRVIDPPDPSPYMPQSLVHRGDNPYGTYTFSQPGDLWAWRSFQSDAQGRFSVELWTSPRYAGDNQTIEGSAIHLPYPITQERCTAALACYTTGVVTAWRRVYLERDRMFRRGTFLRDTVPAGATSIPVVDASEFTNASVSNPIRVALTNWQTTTGAWDRYYEIRHVTGVTGPRNKKSLIISVPTTKAYVASFSLKAPSLYAGAAVGIYQSDSDLYEIDTQLAIDFFKEMYTDNVVLSDVVNQLPFVPFIPECTNIEYCEEITSRSFDTDGQPNHEHIVAASRKPDAAGEVIKHNFPLMYPYHAVLFVYDGEITAAVNNANSNYYGLDRNVVNRETTAHELVHTYDVNQPAQSTFGHCTAIDAMAWNGGHCLMSDHRTTPERGDGLLNLHVNPWDSSEYRRIRRQEEPIPRTFQPNATPNP